MNQTNLLKTNSEEWKWGHVTSCNDMTQTWDWAKNAQKISLHRILSWGFWDMFLSWGHGWDMTRIFPTNFIIFYLLLSQILSSMLLYKFNTNCYEVGRFLNQVYIGFLHNIQVCATLKRDLVLNQPCFLPASCVSAVVLELQETYRSLSISNEPSNWYLHDQSHYLT